MIISVLKESKEREGRVAVTPAQAAALRALGHRVLVESKAGVLSGFPDAFYRKAGAAILKNSGDLIRQAQLVLKVKEPTLEELDHFRPGQMLFCYLHLAAIPQTLKKILAKKIIALGYETVQLPDGSLPLLKPMSEIAGKLATQNGAYFLKADQGGRGVLLGGTSTVKPAEVLLLGAGIVGENAAQIAVGMGAVTHIVDLSQVRLSYLQKKLGKLCRTHLSTPKNISELAKKADLVIGAVLIPGARAPKLISEALVKQMKKGSVIVDVSVDQGGCVETSEVTSHSRPILIKHGVLHYGVPNIPGAVPVTGTLALTRETFPYIKAIAQWGLNATCKKFPEFQGAVNCHTGEIAHSALKNTL